MRKWQNLAAPNDPNAWYDIDGFYPTTRGTYETCYFLAGTEYTATGSGLVKYAFTANTLTGSVEYVVDAAKIWEFTGAGYSDRTGGVTLGSYPYMAQYGIVTIAVFGNAVATAKVTAASGNFSALTGAPKGEIVCVQSNAALIFNTDTSADGWAASDVGDYTNWTTGEAASGRFLQTPGPVTAAVPFGDSVIVFKPTSVYRMRYVGGQVKWASEVIHHMVGCSLDGGATINGYKYMACASPHGVLFCAPGTSSSVNVYYMDGASQFRHVNPLNTLPSVEYQIRYSPDYGVFTLYDTTSEDCYFYCPVTDAWARSTAPHGVASGSLSIVIGQSALTANRNPMPIVHYKNATDKLTRYIPDINEIANKSCFVHSTMYGAPNVKTNWSRVTPILRRRVDKGTDSASLSATFFRELHDTTPALTQAITESGQRARFDFSTTDNHARFKVTFTALDVEIDDLLVKETPAGTD